MLPLPNPLLAPATDGRKLLSNQSIQRKKVLVLAHLLLLHGFGKQKVCKGSGGCARLHHKDALAAKGEKLEKYIKEWFTSK
jgi:hypothetical protein